MVDEPKRDEPVAKGVDVVNGEGDADEDVPKAFVVDGPKTFVEVVPKGFAVVVEVPKAVLPKLGVLGANGLEAVGVENWFAGV